MPENKKTATEQKSKKELLAEVIGKMETAFEHLQQELGDKKFGKRLKKAAKALLHGVLKNDPPAKKSTLKKAAKKAAPKRKASVTQKPPAKAKPVKAPTKKATTPVKAKKVAKPSAKILIKKKS